ncbi:hypothetical protein [Gloeocapsopsis sp. IPPAS B-1203]|nr:hypothetical protein [Gloeocapsopsis sp. IPPAS B-1203]
MRRFPRPVELRVSHCVAGVALSRTSSPLVVASGVELALSG